jgi:hypothetical protein
LNLLRELWQLARDVDYVSGCVRVVGDLDLMLCDNFMGPEWVSNGAICFGTVLENVQFDLVSRDVDYNDG